MFIDVFLFSDTFMMLDKNDMKKKIRIRKIKSRFCKSFGSFWRFFLEFFCQNDKKKKRRKEYIVE